MQLGFTHHALDLLLGETARGCNGDLLFSPGRLIACRHIENTVGIDIEGDLNLRHSTWCGRNAFQAEAAQTLVVSRQFALALQPMDLDRPLVIFRRATELALP